MLNLEGVKKMLENKGHNVFYVALYGSQNYGLDTEKSDFDYKAIILPSLDDLVNNSSPVSKSYEFEGGLVDVKDIRVFIDNLVKCNINFIEILNTEYFIGNTEIRKYFTPLLDELGQLFLKGCYGMMIEKEKAIRHPYPTTIKNIEKFGYDPKQLHHIVRLRILMERYIKGDIGDFKHSGEERKMLIDIKNGGIQNLDVDEIVKKNMEIANKIRNEYTSEMVFDTKSDVIDFGKEFIKQSIVYSIIREFEVSDYSNGTRNIPKRNFLR